MEYALTLHFTTLTVHALTLLCTTDFTMSADFALRYVEYTLTLPCTADCTMCTDFTLYYWLYNECWLYTALCGIYTDFTLYRWLYNVHWLYSVPLTLHALTLPCTTDFTMCTDFTLYYVEFARTSHLNLKRFTQIELPAKLLDYFILSNKSNIKLYYWLLYTKIWGGYGQ